MAGTVPVRQSLSNNPDRREGALLSLTLHLLLLGLAFFFFRRPLTTEIVAAGEGAGAGTGAIEVGVVEAGQLGLSQPRPLSLPGNEPDALNNELIETTSPVVEDGEIIDRTRSDRRLPTDRQTERPTARQSDQLVSKTPLRGGSADRQVEVGRSSGSQLPSLTGGVGVGSGAGVAGTGLPGGSEYGRRIQVILSRNYNPPAVGTTATEFVIVQLRIARDGRILSLTNGRLNPAYLKRRSSIDLVNYAAERAVIASSPLPPFPNGFLMESQEATAEIWFRYPK
jgi:hypothetical protein